jgi:hypothetical protein
MYAVGRLRLELREIGAPDTCLGAREGEGWAPAFGEHPLTGVRLDPTGVGLRLTTVRTSLTVVRLSLTTVDRATYSAPVGTLSLDDLAQSYRVRAPTLKPRRGDGIKPGVSTPGPGSPHCRAL